MKNKTIVFSSIALAVFLLVVGTGIVTNAFAKQPTNQVTPNLVDFMAREQAYQKLVNEANQKIELANQQIVDLMESTPEVIETPLVPYLFTAEQAAQIAANLTETQPNELPELVDFNGTPAYEVEFENNQFDGKVYVDANTGAILYNGLQQKSVYITTAQAVAIATNYLGGGTVIGVNFGEFDETQVYIVQFSNGQSVYIDFSGEIIAVQMAPGSNGKHNDSDDDHDSESDDD